ncbi:MAG: hypothetical protein FJZ87_14485 [Chloroflexi bacterium]|nr:hypothetical protein [Chloroflexota bacterium]
MTNDQLSSPEPEDLLFGEPIYSYSRAQAIEDGVLVDVTDIARQVGFRFPVAITCALDDRLQPSRHDLGQDHDGRLWDVLWVAALSIRLIGRDTDTGEQEVDPKDGKLQTIELRLQAVCGPGDEGEPVITKALVLYRVGFPHDF